MKKARLCFVLITMLMAQLSFAQDGKIETLTGGGKGKIRVGGFGAPTIKFTTFDNKMGVLLGGYAGVMLNSKLMLGAGAYALANNIEAARTNASDPTLYWNMWYTGFVPEYTIKSNKLFHAAVSALIGGGGVMKNERYKGFDQSENMDYSGFFVAEPQVNFEMNITSYLRVAIGGSYRLVSGSSTQGITDEKLSGPAAHFSIKAGRF